MKHSRVFGLAFGFLVLTFLLSVNIGAYDIPLDFIVKSLWHRLTDMNSEASLTHPMEMTLYHIRIPRILLVMMVGMSLAGSGVSLQAIFRNPLVDPFILGISAGAAMGAALSLAFLPMIPIQATAFAFGLLAVLLALFLARSHQELPVISMILAGIVVSSFCSAGLSVIQFMVDPDRLGSIVFWLMGSFSLASWKSVSSVIPVMAAGLLILYGSSWRLNVLSMGEEEARSLGLAANRYRKTIIITASLLTASSVSVCGIIGWVGLIVPHIARFLVGPEHHRLVPFTILCGGIFMLWADNLSRSLADFEVPIGIITSLCGAPLFMVLLKKGQENWSH